MNKLAYKIVWATLKNTHDFIMEFMLDNKLGMNDSIMDLLQAILRKMAQLQVQEKSSNDR